MIFTSALGLLLDQYVYCFNIQFYVDKITAEVFFPCITLVSQVFYNTLGYMLPKVSSKQTSLGAKLYYKKESLWVHYR